MKHQKIARPEHRNTNIKDQNSKVLKKIKKLQKQLTILYPEYEYLNTRKTNNIRLEYLINIISKTEYKYIYYLKKRV